MRYNSLIGKRQFKLRVITIVFTVLMIFFCFLTIDFAARERIYNEESIELSERHMKYTDIATGLTEGSHTLTEEVRQFAETGNILHLDQYFVESKIDKNRDKAVEELAKMTASPTSKAYLDFSMRYSVRLMDREYYSMRLAALAYDIPEDSLPIEVVSVTLTEEDIALPVEEMKEKARMMLFDEQYMNMKRLITDGANRFLTSVRDGIEIEYAALTAKVEFYARALEGTIFALSLLILLMSAFQYLYVIRPIAKASRSIRDSKPIEMPAFLEEMEALSASYNKLLADNAVYVEKLRVAAETDALTGLGNRAAYNAYCKKLPEQGGKVILFVFDVNELRETNNLYGHDDGDRLLKNSADCIFHVFANGTDQNCFRIGGDEFAAFITGEDEHIADEYVEAFAKETKRRKVKVAVGYRYTSDIASASLAQMFEEADQKMYLDKAKMKVNV